MNKFITVVTHPLGLAGYSLFILCKLYENSQHHWIPVLIGILAAVCVVGGLIRGFSQLSSGSQEEKIPEPPISDVPQETQTVQGPASTVTTSDLKVQPTPKPKKPQVKPKEKPAEKISHFKEKSPAPSKGPAIQETPSDLKPSTSPTTVEAKAPSVPKPKKQKSKVEEGMGEKEPAAVKSLGTSEEKTQVDLTNEEEGKEA